MGLTKTVFRQKLLAWYHENKRNLPWRHTKDPYKIWVSEIILQQTRVAQGTPYYERFISTFPDVRQLAQASEEKVLRLWQGLGYYSRARNMHRCAKKISSELKGRFPATYEGLLGLPGVGPYTAAAIGSMAFGQPVAVVDGNVFRVLARIFGMDQDISTPAAKRTFTEKANELLDGDHPGDFNQAMMEFGATCCTPKKPACALCPFASACVANARNLVEQLPVKLKKQNVRVRYFHYLVFEYRNRIALRARTDDDIWKGLYDFFLLESSRPLSEKRIMQEAGVIPQAEKTKVDKVGSVKHILSHQQLRIKCFRVRIESKRQLPDGMKLFSRRKADALPKPIVISRLLDKIRFERG